MQYGKSISGKKLTAARLDCKCRGNKVKRNPSETILKGLHTWRGERKLLALYGDEGEKERGSRWKICG